ncbi:MAG: YrhA family protein [Burkholderiales bacterium]
MSIEHLVAAIQNLRHQNDEFVPPPATEDAIVALAVQFQSEFGLALPEAYQRVLRLSDGILFDGLTVWPTQRHWLFRESLIEANRDLRETIEDSLVYFGKRDDIVFVLDQKREVYAALEMSGMSEWETFDDAEEMMTFMLQRVVDENEDPA